MAHPAWRARGSRVVERRGGCAGGCTEAATHHFDQVEHHGLGDPGDQRRPGGLGLDGRDVAGPTDAVTQPVVHPVHQPGRDARLALTDPDVACRTDSGKGRGLEVRRGLRTMGRDRERRLSSPKRNTCSQHKYVLSHASEDIMLARQQRKRWIVARRQRRWGWWGWWKKGGGRGGWVGVGREGVVAHP